MIRIGHFSDSHGNLTHITGTPDVWVCTGDFFPNETRGKVAVEAPFQTAWFEANADALIARLGGKPLIWLAGNHDYVDLAKLLRARGCVAWNVAEAPVDFMGERFAGFEGIPWIVGEWHGELFDFHAPMEAVLAQDPTVLLTHTPPSGILDNDEGKRGPKLGASPITSKLGYYHHRIHTHLFGHIHEQGGMDTEQMGIRFYNGACIVRIISVG